MRLLTILAALSGAIAVVAGAFGAHGAASKEAADWLRTGAQYQMVHAVAALIAIRMDERISPWLFIVGAAVFSATLYLMALGLPHWLGAITPIGGAALIAGWICMAWSTVSRQQR